MGACTSDIYKTLKKQYGQSFKKLIIHQAAQTKLKELIKTKEKQYHQKITQKTQLLHREVDKRELLLDNNFQQSKLILQSQLPYDLASLEQMKKTSLKNLLGLDEYKKKFAQTRELIKTESNQRSNDFSKKGEEVMKKFEGEFQIDQEKLKALHDLSLEKRKFIQDKGVKEFETSINAKIAEVQSENAGKLNFQQGLKNLEKIISMKELDEIVNRSKSQFRTEVAKIVGSNLDTKIEI